MDNFKIINSATLSNGNIQLPIVIYFNHIYYVIKVFDNMILLEIYTEIILQDTQSVVEIVNNNSVIKIEKYKVSDNSYEHIIYSHDKLYFKNTTTLQNFLTYKLLNNYDNETISSNLNSSNLNNNNLNSNNLTLMFANIIDILDSNNIRLKGAQSFIYKEFKNYNNNLSNKFIKYFNRYIDMLGNIYI
jgi:hypothetical protein